MIDVNVPLLIFSNTKNDSDLRYLIGTHVPDDIALVFDGEISTVLVSALEIQRLKKSSKVDKFISWDSLKHEIGAETVADFDVLQKFLDSIGLRKFCVKQGFPVLLADKLRASGFEISIVDFNTLPQRMTKFAFEVVEIRSACEVVRKIFAEVEKILANSNINSKNELVFENEVLTSERLRMFMENFSYQLGAFAEDTIVSCGNDACDPHNQGHGSLRANEFILIDFFPYLRNSGYFADVSRTFLKGRATSEQLKLWTTVRDAQKAAIEMIRSDVTTNEIMLSVLDFFEKNGYQTSKISNPPYGMFHSLGHGFGLDIHESPKVGLSGDVLKKNMVITIEPGLYYKGIGGVRIEDDILVCDDGCEILTNIPCDFVIE